MTFWLYEDFSKNRNNVFLLRSMFVINNFDEKSIYIKIIFSYTFFKGIFSVEMQAERRAIGPKIVKKTSFEDQDGILLKIFNDKSWPQQEDMFSNLRNLEKVKNKLHKIQFHYVFCYFQAIIKEFCTKHYSH